MTCEPEAGSTVNINTGRLSHEQELFALKSGQPLSLDISLYYRSIQFAPSNIGNGWSHSYEMALQTGSNGSVTFWNNGKRRIYTLYSNVYYPPNGDFSSLVKNPDGTYLITEKDGLERKFDSSGAITSIVDRNNNALSFTYTSGRLTSVTDPNNRTVTFGYDDTIGKLSAITDPRGNAYILGYTGGKLTSVTNPDTGHWDYTYDPTYGLLETKTDPENNQTVYHYDPSKRLDNRTNPVGLFAGVSYPEVAATGKIPDCYMFFAILPQRDFTLTIEDAGWTYTFDTLTETISKKVDPLGNTYTYTYDSKRNMLTSTEPGFASSVTTTYTYDTKGNGVKPILS